MPRTRLMLLTPTSPILCSPTSRFLARADWNSSRISRRYVLDFQYLLFRCTTNRFMPSVFCVPVARGYITKHEGGKKLMQAIHHVLSGQIYVSEKMSAHILETFSGGQAASVRSLIAQLSDREFEVFELLGEGLSARKIAERLHLSTKTVDAHRANIKTKLVIKTTPELISYAARWIEHRANRK